MEERYEIRGKIGQGGLGAVYRGYDTRMNREIAIKRISMAEDDPALLEESTRQLIKEAGALASLQHPHIVTVYDVGADEDGPYVVMELISGKTLDELIERAPLTWSDFREMALQTEEALIAAQELHLIHSDIKPSNLMLTWLPSGKFQIKIVDFGLATLTHAQSKEDLQEIEAVFGSIFFMAPEQFERVPIDARVDMYAMGCVYYQALTGIYPFQGETGNEVMESHLLHRVIPIQEVRADIPLWACDWIMWHINRQAVDRPESAREALQVFLQNDKNPKPAMSLGKPAPAQPLGPRPRLVSPNGQLVVAQPLAQAARTITAPQPLLPPEGSKPSIYTAPIEIPETLPTGPVLANPPPPRHYSAPSATKPSSGLKIAIVAAACLVIGVAGFALRQRVKATEGARHYQQMLAAAGTIGTREISMTGAEFERFLDAVATADSDEKRETIFKALYLANANDGSDFDAKLTEFATKGTQMLPEVRAALIRNVLAKRASPKMVPGLTEFARSTNDVRSAVAAIEAVHSTAGDSQFNPFLSVMQFHPNAELRKAAEESAAAILKRSSNRGTFLKSLTTALGSAKDPKIHESLLRLQTAAGG